MYLVLKQRFLTNQFRACGVEAVDDTECSGLNVAKEQFWEDYFDKSATSSWSDHQNYTNVCRADTYCLAYLNKCAGVVQIRPRQ